MADSDSVVDTDPTVAFDLPLTLDRVTATRLLAQASAIIEGIHGGHIKITDDPGVPSLLPVHQPRKQTIAEHRAEKRARLLAHAPTSIAALARALRHAPEPKRHHHGRKRPTPFLTTYTVKKTHTPDALAALSTLTPAAATILVYLNKHREGVTVLQIATETRFKPKTVQNALSTLRLFELIDSKRRPAPSKPKK